MTETGGQLHAYALMTNHVHLLVTPRRAATVAKLIISLGRRYVQYINTSYRRTGISVLAERDFLSGKQFASGCDIGVDFFFKARGERMLGLE